MIDVDIPYTGIHYYKNAISDSNKILQSLESLDKDIPEHDDEYFLSKWKVWTANRSDSEFIFGYQKRVRQHLRNNEHLPLYKDLEKIVVLIENAIVNVSKDYANYNDIEIGSLAPVSISKYIEGAYMGPHTDSYDDDEKPTISVVAYLNDEYQGGEINFPNQGVNIKPEAGSIVVFPSRSPYVHESKTIISGTKYMSPGFWFKN